MYRNYFFIHSIFSGLLLLGGWSLQDAPIRLNSQNPHYFEWQGRPVILVGSTEHYGAVLNLDFDFEPYFRTLEKDGLNLTRAFTGVYCEHSGAFKIEKNTLAPAAGKLIAPWARSSQAGYANGGNKFDLDVWDKDYFMRLKKFVETAKEHGVVVELVLFCPFYGDEQWRLSPLNRQNNVNEIGDLGRTEVFTLKDSEMTRIQEEMVRKIVTELNAFDNLIYEICNEPYFAGPTLEWQAHIAQIIRQTESGLPHRHMIAQNIANRSQKIVDPDPNIDLFNFHYATSAAVDENYHLDKALGDDETGFAGTEDRPYRQEAWNFLISGGALFDHLDYSFTTEHEEGDFQFPATQPGGGGSRLRSQFRVLKDFLESYDLVSLRPMQDHFAGEIPKGVEIRAIGQPGKEYAFYLYRKLQLHQNFSLRWSGFLTPEVSDRFTFHTITDDGVRLTIDGNRLIDDWNSHAPKENVGSIDLRAGKPVPITMEYFQGLGGATAQLFWSRPAQKKKLIEAEYFRIPDGTAPGLKIEWFDDKELESFQAEAVVFGIDFDGFLEDVFPSEDSLETVRFFWKLSPGNYRIQWIQPVSGQILQEETVENQNDILQLTSPPFDEDVALSIRRN